MSKSKKNANNIFADTTGKQFMLIDGTLYPIESVPAPKLPNPSKRDAEAAAYARIEAEAEYFADGNDLEEKFYEVDCTRRGAVLTFAGYLPKWLYHGLSVIEDAELGKNSAGKTTLTFVTADDAAAWKAGHLPVGEGEMMHMKQEWEAYKADHRAEWDDRKMTRAIKAVDNILPNSAKGDIDKAFKKAAEKWGVDEKALRKEYGKTKAPVSKKSRKSK